MRVLLSGGGTAGHINPAIAIAKYIKEAEPESKFLFVGTEYGLEKSLVPREGFDISFVSVMGLRRRLTFENFKVFVKFISSYRACKKIIAKFKPDVVIGTGGYVCVPVVAAAHRAKIPTLIHEQNVFPGIAVKFLSRFASITAISFEETKKYLPGCKNILLSGNPLRAGLIGGDYAKARAKLGIDSRPLVVMFGGSLGAEYMNEALIELLKAGGTDYFNLIAATGEKHYEYVINSLKGVKLGENIRLVPYIYDMDKALCAADLVISRAGAITVSEICALGKAAILIPSPYVAHNHQEYNARLLEKRGAAKVLLESELSGRALSENIKDMLKDGCRLAKMAEASRQMGITDACEKIYRAVKSLVR